MTDPQDLDAVAAYETGGVHDSAGREEEAMPYYLHALELGLDEPLFGQLVIQTASTLRNLRRYEEGLALLDRIGESHPLADAAAFVRALIFSSQGRLVEALSLGLGTLAPHLPRYQKSMAAYADELPERIADGN
jgi:tetratricopeptide (TPR) repeat protein